MMGGGDEKRLVSLLVPVFVSFLLVQQGIELVVVGVSLVLAAMSSVPPQMTVIVRKREMIAVTRTGTAVDATQHPVVIVRHLSPYRIVA